LAEARVEAIGNIAGPDSNVSRTHTKALCRASVEPPYAELRAEPRAEPLYVELRVELRVELCAELCAELYAVL